MFQVNADTHVLPCCRCPTTRKDVPGMVQPNICEFPCTIHFLPTHLRLARSLPSRESNVRRRLPQILAQDLDHVGPRKVIQSVATVFLLLCRDALFLFGSYGSQHGDS